MQRINNNTLKIVPPKAELQSYIDRWLMACKANDLSEKTIIDYERAIARFVWWFDDYSGYAGKLGSHPEVITLDVLREFVAYLREKQPNGRWGLPAAADDASGGWMGASKTGLSPVTIRYYVTIVKVFFNWLEEEGHIEKTPFTRALKISVSRKQQSRIVKTVSSEDIARIFEVLQSPVRLRTYEGCRNLAIVAFLLDTGVRRGELLSIKYGDLEKERRRCKVRGKTGERFVFYSTVTANALNDYLDTYRREQSDNPATELWLTKDEEPLSYPALGNMIFALEKTSGVDFHAHSLRHTFATMVAASGVNVFDLKEMLGHASIDTTQLYVQSNPDMLQAAHRSAAPLATLDIGKRRRGRPRRGE
jgi:site-specific recombinase XerD